MVADHAWLKLHVTPYIATPGGPGLPFPTPLIVKLIDMAGVLLEYNHMHA